METTVSRTRSQRAGTSRRRRHGIEENSRTAQIIKQFIICAAIFVIYLTMKNINNSYTNFLTGKTSAALRTDTDFSSVISSTKKFFSSLNITNEKLQSVFNYQISDASESKDAAIPANMQEKTFDGALLKNKGFILPLSGAVTSGFGTRTNPVTKKNEFHEGVDIAGKTGEDIKAALDGEVLEAKNNPSLGNYVKLRHSDDITSLYAHASGLSVKEGQLVSKGEVVAKVGSTGLADGPHLHFELRKGDKLINPQSVLNFGTTQVVEGG